MRSMHSRPMAAAFWMACVLVSSIGAARADGLPAVKAYATTKNITLFDPATTPPIVKEIRAVGVMPPANQLVVKEVRTNNTIIVQLPSNEVFAVNKVQLILDQTASVTPPACPDTQIINRAAGSSQYGSMGAGEERATCGHGRTK